MAKKKTQFNPVENELIEDRDIVVEMEESSLAYAVKTIADRALPDVRDGLKPVLRRVLYAGHRKGLVPEKHYVKNADWVGDTMGKYHPHGDGSIYGVIVNASQGWNYRYPLVDFQGNNGSLDGDPAAAYRYTEGKLDKKSLQLLGDVDKESVDFVPNYAETTVEPTVLPSLFPNLLANGGSGIAVGYTTDIPSHNLNEVIEAIKAQIKNPEISVIELLQYVKGPDFAIGGQLIVDDKIQELYETGRGSLRFRGTFFVEENDETDNLQIVFNSLPPDENKPKLVEKLYECCIEKKSIPRVIDVRDESEGNEIRIVLELHKTAVPDIVVAEVFNQTRMEKNKSYIMRALVDQSPKILTLKEIIQYYIEHRREVVERRTNFDLKKAEDRLHLLEGFEKILDNMDEVISIIRSSDTTKDASDSLIKRFQLSDIQVKAILDMPLRRLTKLEEGKIRQEITEVKAEIAGYEKILSNQQEVDKVILSEINKLKKDFGDERRTQLVTEDDLNKAANMQVSDEEMVVILTNKGTIKQIPMSSFEEMEKAGSLRERQEVFIQATKATIGDTFILVLETGDYVKTNFNDLITNLDSIAEGKKVIAVIRQDLPKENESEKVVHVVTKSGQIIKTEMSRFKARLKRIAPLIKLKDKNDKVVGVRISDGSEDNIITIATEKGVVHRFFEQAFTTSNPGGSGVPCIGSAVIKDGDNVVDFDINKQVEDESYKVLLYLEDSQGIGIKTMSLTEFKPKGRVSKGIVGTEFRRSGGTVHKMKLTKDDFYVIDGKGKVYRSKLVSVTPQNRYNKPESYDFIPLSTKFFLNM